MKKINHKIMKKDDLFIAISIISIIITILIVYFNSRQYKIEHRYYNNNNTYTIHTYIYRGNNLISLYSFSDYNIKICDMDSIINCHKQKAYKKIQEFKSIDLIIKKDRRLL